MVAVLLSAVAVLVLVLWHLARRLSAAERQLVEVARVRRAVEEVSRQSTIALGVTRAHLAAVAAGEAPDRDVILRGAPYRELAPPAGLALYERTGGLFVLDVRTPAEHAAGHIPNAHLIPVDELEDRLAELPAREAPILVHCATGGRSAAACRILAEQGFVQLFNLAGGMHEWPGPQVRDEHPPPPASAQSGTAVSYRGGPVGEQEVIAALRECFDPEIPLNVFDLGLIYGIDIDESRVAVKMTLTSEGCPSARAIPEEVRRRIAALGPADVTVDVVWEPPWHPSRISAEGKQRLGLS
jgi:metal-sulfur cluster biosynthetic enzyme/rhodanese-related sulfurtransferase